MTTPEQTSITAKLVDLAGALAATVDTAMGSVVDARDRIRAGLLEDGGIAKIPAAADLDLPRSMCAVDGARIREQTYAMDLLFAAAAAKDARFTDEKLPVEPFVWAHAIQHADGTDALVQTAMASAELRVAATAPHDLVALDGSLLTPLIGLEAGLFAKRQEIRAAAAKLALELDAAGALRTLLDRPRRGLVALTKSDSASKFAADYAARFNVQVTAADRVLATQVLRPGELLAPRVLTEAAARTVNESRSGGDVKRAVDALAAVSGELGNLAERGKLYTTYFKPVGAHTVIRFEFLSAEREAVADATYLAGVLNADTSAPHLLEPFCQYAVDSEVKSISAGAKALRARMIAELPPQRAETYRTLLAEGYRT